MGKPNRAQKPNEQSGARFFSGVTINLSGGHRPSQQLGPRNPPSPEPDNIRLGAIITKGLAPRYTLSRERLLLEFRGRNRDPSGWCR